MLEDIPCEEQPEDPLVLQAMLYVSGELEPEQIADFERLLGEDQAVRDALCRAVELVQTLNGQESAGPDPAIRARVSRRLRQRRRHRLALADSGSSTNAALWSVMGAAIAVVVMLALSHMAMTPTTTPPGTAQSVNPTTSREEPAVADDEEKTAEMANVWADLHSSDRLEKVVREEELRRKLRLARTDDRRPPTSKN